MSQNLKLIKNLKLIFFINITIVILFFLSINIVRAQILIDEVVGEFFNNSVLIVNGQEFGQKGDVMPFRSSYQNQVSEMNFQEINSFNDSYWSLVGSPLIDLQNIFKRLDSRSYVRLEYSSLANESSGYSAGVQSDFPQTVDSYMAWWDYFEPDFDFSHMQTGGNNIKYFYMGVGGQPHHACQIYGNGEGFTGDVGGLVGGGWPDCQDNLDLPFGEGYYARCLSWHMAYPVPLGEWFFVEEIMHMNSAPGVFDGWREMRINNNRIYFVKNTDFYENNHDNDEFYQVMRWGGNYGYDDSGTTQYRYYGDLYLDGSFSRILIGDNQNYTECTHLELQIPTSWSTTSVSFLPNRGSFNDNTNLYLYVINEDNIVNEVGYQLTFDNNSVDIIADVNQDLQINTTDAMLTLRNSLGLNMTKTTWQVLTTTGDVNCDNNSNSTDAMLLLRYSLGFDMSETDWCE